MIYQDPLVGIKPYVAKFITGKGFPNHKHYELEIIYCIKGFLDIVVNDIEYRVSPGDALIVGSMIPHAYKKSVDGTKAILLEMGPVFLREKFHHIEDVRLPSKLYKKGSEADEFLTCLENMRPLIESEDNLSYMLIIGKMYELFVHIVRDLSKETSSESNNKEVNNLTKIDKALSLVHERYHDQITVDNAAHVCGYGKSNFCRVFKSVMGVSFHQYLNNYRIENAKYLLTETTMSLERIALTVGFQDAKVFCRVFKSLLHTSPGQYRRSTRQST